MYKLSLFLAIFFFSISTQGQNNPADCFREAVPFITEYKTFTTSDMLISIFEHIKTNKNTYKKNKDNRNSSFNMEATIKNVPINIGWSNNKEKERILHIIEIYEKTGTYNFSKHDFKSIYIKYPSPALMEAIKICLQNTQNKEFDVNVTHQGRRNYAVKYVWSKLKGVEADKAKFVDIEFNNSKLAIGEKGWQPYKRKSGTYWKHLSNNSLYLEQIDETRCASITVEFEIGSRREHATLFFGVRKELENINVPVVYKEKLILNNFETIDNLRLTHTGGDSDFHMHCHFRVDIKFITEGNKVFCKVMARASEERNNQPVGDHTRGTGMWEIPIYDGDPKGTKIIGFDKSFKTEYNQEVDYNDLNFGEESKNCSIGIIRTIGHCRGQDFNDTSTGETTRITSIEIRIPIPIVVEKVRNETKSVFVLKNCTELQQEM